jgi:predicted ATPase/class 3 adenylate cyclase
MQCPRCQARNREGRRFCAECGAALALPCPACGFSNEPGEKFCGGCGQPLLSPPPAAPKFASPRAYTPKHLADRILTSRSALAGERKQVTVLFADLKGSLELLAERDPEEAQGLLDPILERMMEAVHRYEGTVNQVMGDGIMALFGAPLAHEDHALRACYAALWMQEAVDRHAEPLRRSQGLDLRVRVGLNSGEVVVRSIGNDLHTDYSAVGETTHLAARMEQMARPGGILLTGRTLGLVEGYVEARSLGPARVKGLPEPVETYELVRARSATSRLQAVAARGLTPFVGREAELSALRQAFKWAEGGHGQVVAIVGEPGVGKSRLFWEFVHSIGDQGRLVLETVAVSYTRASAYFPIGDLLRRYFQVDSADDPAAVREKVKASLLVHDRALEPALAPLLTLLDVPVEDSAWEALDPARKRQRTREALKRLFIRESLRQPLVLVFENLHWIDSETQGFLDSLVESLPTAHILLLVTYRPEYRHGWGSKTYYSQIRLDALPPESAGELLQALLGPGSGPEPLVKLLIERTEGNPLFLEECVRTLVETKALVGRRGDYRLAKDPPGAAVPPTIQAVLAARIDRLPAEEKRLLQAASVIGRDVPFALLLAIADCPEDDLRARLGELQAAEFLYESSLFPELEYTFKHALTHDVAYTSLLGERRRALHARILEVLERTAEDRLPQVVDQLAHHAYLGQVWDRAVTYLRQAGARALARSANQEAVAHFQQALAALGHLPEAPTTLERAIDLRFDLRPPLLQLGRLQEVLSLSQEAEALAHRLGDEERLAHVYTYLINYHYLRGEPDLAIEYGERCLATARTRHDLALEALARRYMGHSYHAQGRYRQAEEILRENIEALQARPPEPEREQAALAHVASAGWLALTLAELGDFDLGQRYADEAQRAAEASELAYSQTIAWALAGAVWVRRGHLERALPLLERSLRATREKSLIVWRPIPASLLGLALCLLGRSAQGLPLLEEGVQLSEELGVGAYLARWTTHLGEGLLAAGQTERALAATRRALDLARAHKEEGHQAWALRLEAEIASRAPRPDLATGEAAYREAIALAERLGMLPLGALSRLGLARLHRRAGNREKAEGHLAAALAGLHRMDMRFWLEQAEGEIRELGGPFVVPAGHAELFWYLKDRFAMDAALEILHDRRRGDRRQRQVPRQPERRRGERRRRARASSAS